MAGKSHDYFDVIVFDKLHFGDSGINELEITILKTHSMETLWGVMGRSGTL